MYIKIATGLLMSLCLVLAACGFNKDSEVSAFITEFDAATNEIVAKIDANPSEAGVDEAQKAFDARKASLRSKFDAFKNAKGAQVSQDMQKKLNDSTEKNMKSIMDVSTKHAMTLGSDPDAAKKFQKLMEDYSNTFKM